MAGSALGPFLAFMARAAAEERSACGGPGVMATRGLGSTGLELGHQGINDRKVKGRLARPGVNPTVGEDMAATAARALGRAEAQGSRLRAAEPIAAKLRAQSQELRS